MDPRTHLISCGRRERESERCGRGGSEHGNRAGTEIVKPVDRVINIWVVIEVSWSKTCDLDFSCTRLPPMLTHVHLPLKRTTSSCLVNAVQLYSSRGVLFQVLSLICWEVTPARFRQGLGHMTGNVKSDIRMASARIRLPLPLRTGRANKTYFHSYPRAGTWCWMSSGS